MDNNVIKEQSVEVTLTQTNSHGWIAICPCGWTSGVHPSPRKKPSKKAKATARDYDIGQEAALADWRNHRNAQHAEPQLEDGRRFAS
jgi:hypothetical protein